MKSLLYSLSFFLLCVPAFASGDPLLDSYLKEARANNPSLAAAQARVDAARTMIPQAGALPDPMVGFGVANLPSPTFNFRQEPMTGKWISVKQAFPFPGVRSLKSKIATEHANQAASAADNADLSLEQEVKRIYYRWAEVRATIRLTKKHRELVKQLIDITTAAYRVGKGAQQDVLRAQTEWLGYDDQLLELAQSEESVKASFAALLGRNDASTLEAPAELAQLPADSLSGDLEQLLKDHNPALQNYEAKLAAAKQAKQLADREKYPSFAIGAKYAQRDASPAGMARDDFWSFDVSTSIPLYMNRKQNKLQEQRQIELRQTDEEFSDLKNKLRAKLVDLKSALATANEQTQLYDSAILPQVKQAYNAALADYEVGRIGFSELIAAQRSILNAELKRLNRITSYYTARAELEALVGRALTTAEK